MNRPIIRLFARGLWCLLILVAAQNAYASAHKVINFDDLPNNTTVTNQYSSVTFSSNSGTTCHTLADTHPSSPPNDLVAGTYTGNPSTSYAGETTMSFVVPVNNLTFKVMSTSTTGTVAKIDVYQNGAFSTTVPITGTGNDYVPVAESLVSFKDITKIRIYAINDPNGIGYDDITFDQDLLYITATNPVNPNAIVWNPATMTSFPLSATVKGPVADNIVVKLTIYDGYQNPIANLSQTATINSSGSTVVNFSWNGQYDSGGTVPLGTYLFQFNVTDSNGAMDTDKSPYLGISEPGNDPALVAETSAGLTYNVPYALTSTDNPARSASAGEIDVYDSSLTKVATQSLGVSDMTPGAHQVAVTVPLPQDDVSYTFLVNAQDNDADQDIAGRQRWALDPKATTKYGLITLLTVTDPTTGYNYHIAWCRVNHNIQLRTAIPQGGSQAHAPQQFVNGTPAHSYRAAVNGSLFNTATTQFPYQGVKGPSGVLDYGEIGIAGLWKTYIPCPKKRWCFGMPSSLTQGNLYTAARMVVKPGRAGRPTGIYQVTSAVRSYQYGFSGVGLLALGGQPIADPGASVWPVSSSTKTTRTAIAWSNRGDFFLVTTSQGSWSTMRDWFLSPNGLVASSKDFKSLAVQVQGAVMLDGGGSTEFAYKRSFVTVTTDDGKSVSDGRYIPSIVEAYH